MELVEKKEKPEIKLTKKEFETIIDLIAFFNFSDAFDDILIQDLIDTFPLSVYDEIECEYYDIKIID